MIELERQKNTLYRTFSSEEEAIDRAVKSLPILDSNHLNSVLGAYKNTILEQVKKLLARSACVEKNDVNS